MSKVFNVNPGGSMRSDPSKSNDSRFDPSIALLRDATILQTDQILMRECRFEAYRASGPGGQKRNKTSSAVRVTHLPTGIFATAKEERSMHDNRVHALHRLRWELAIAVRNWTERTPITLEKNLVDGRLGTPLRLDRIVFYAQLIDVLAASGFVISDAADWLGISTGNLSKVIQQEDQVLAHVNQNRIDRNLRALGS